MQSNRSINEQVSNAEKKYVIILGSGIHKEAYGNDVVNCLTDWKHLLKSIGYKSSINNNQNYILNFELLLSKETRKQSEKKASKIEGALLKNASKKIEKQQKISVSKKEIKYPLEIFNPQKVSDVISLNFDLVPELLINNGKIPTAKYCNYTDTKNEIKHTKNIGITRHRIIGNKKDGKITFWHPHGDIKLTDSMQLGIRKYGKSVNEIELLRNRFKQQENRKSKKPNDYSESWYDKIINQPVIILGASISDSEWDLWFALVNKMRNFAKKENIKHESHILKMNCDGENFHNDIFTEIIPNSTDFIEQWQAVKKLLS